MQQINKTPISKTEAPFWKAPAEGAAVHSPGPYPPQVNARIATQVWLPTLLPNQ